MKSYHGAYSKETKLYFKFTSYINLSDVFHLYVVQAPLFNFVLKSSLYKALPVYFILRNHLVSN